MTDFPDTATRERVEPQHDQYGRYVLPHPITGNPTPYTRATTFAKSISDLYVVNLWATRMAIKGLTMQPSLYALVAATPLEDRKQLNDLAERAKEAAAARAGADLGTAIHAFTEQVDRGETPTIPADYQADITAYRQALVTHGLQIVPEYIERTVLVPPYNVAGTFDRLIRDASGHLIVGDVKTGRDLSYGWNEISIQLALYAHALFIYDYATRQYTPMPEVNQLRALVFHLPVGKAECTVYSVDIQQGWEAARLCQEVRTWRATRQLAAPLSVNAADPPPPHADYATWEDKLRTASSVGELRAVWQAIVAADARTPELASLGILRRKQLDELPAGTA